MIDGAPMAKDPGLCNEYTVDQIRRIQLSAANYIIETTSDEAERLAHLKELLSYLGVPHNREYESRNNRLNSAEYPLKTQAIQ